MKPRRPIIAVHLDLKGVAFRPSYIPRLLDDLAAQGVNTVMIEYEDLFPFDGVKIARDNSVTWSRRTLDGFVEGAQRRGLQVIPKMQCLGHLEYVFRWNRYRRFALDRAYPSTLDIRNPRACALIFSMLRQIIEAHPHSRLIHVGMDEAHALVTHAKKTRRDVVELFTSHLAKLCDLCGEHGRTPMIWSDMIEDHVTSRALRIFKKFRDRVVICPWDYSSSGDRMAVGRLAGYRVSREWLDEPENPDAPAIGPGHTFTEEMPAFARRLVAPYRNGRFFTPMFQADLWTRLGFRVLGATAIRSSESLATLPYFNTHLGNIRAWSRAIRRTRQLGLVGTSWARGTSWCPSGFNMDLCWPLIAVLARSMGAKPRPFFRGIPEKTVDRIVRTLGRCRADWRLEGKVAEEMRRLTPRLRDHRHEWKSLWLMTRLLALQRRAEYALLEVDVFHAHAHPVDTEWLRRLKDQRGILRELAVMRREVHSHFRKRYHGDAFEEWMRDLFDLGVRRLREAGVICREKLRRVRRLYSVRGG